MPELPEVETIRNGLSRFILFKEIKSVDLVDLTFLKSGNKDELLGLEKDEFVEISRVGKAIVFSFKKCKKKLIIHLKMTGQLIYFSDKKALIVGGHSEKKNDVSKFNHIRLKFNFIDDSYLILNDTRRFAYLKLLDDVDFEIFKDKLGVDPLSDSFNINLFLSFFEKRKKNVKAFLLDQSLVSGIGNIYADEVLFASGISPFRSVNSLKIEEKKLLFKNIKKILRLAVEKRGTTFSDYVDIEGNSGGFVKLLKVYGRGGMSCKKCGGKIVKTRVAGRGTHYCPSCQK
jgi:formamidopyrimidine-DNA glycosylase